MKRRRFLLAALALVLVIAAGSVYWFWLRGADETIATITPDGEVIAEYDRSHRPADHGQGDGKTAVALHARQIHRNHRNLFIPGFL